MEDDFFDDLTSMPPFISRIRAPVMACSRAPLQVTGQEWGRAFEILGEGAYPAEYLPG